VVRAFLAGLLLAGVPVVASTSDDPLPVLTVCEVLSDLPRYEGTTVIVVGRVSSSMEGIWLDEECGIKVLNGDREFQPSIWLAWGVDYLAPPPQMPRGFRWNKSLLRQKLEQVKRTTRLRVYKGAKGDEWLALFGRLETRLPRRIKIGEDRYGYADGFGHEASSPAQLVAPASGYLHLRAE
jgi:hypothetical protein